MTKPSKSKPLYERLVYAFGSSAVDRQLHRLIARFTTDPLRYITDEGKQSLFEELLADMKWTKRNNARNRRIAAERRAHGTQAHQTGKVGAG